MYNRYVPSADGTYQRRVMPSPQKSPQRPSPQEPPKTPPPPPEPPKPESCLPSKPIKPPLQLHLDTGDVLVLLILLLVLNEGEEIDTFSILITLAVFLLTQ